MIYTLTLNPAIDRILYLPYLKKNITNRIQHSIDTIGGKGTHVSINLQTLNEDNTALGICHGNTGQRIIDMLKKSGVRECFNHFTEGKSESRTNYLLIENGHDCTIIAESGVKLTEHEVSAMLRTMNQLLTHGDYLILSGDASNSPDAAIYNRIIRFFSNKNLKIFMDTSGPSLKESLLDSPYMIKPNLDELSYLCGQQIPNTDADIIAAIHSLDEYRISVIAVSLGESGSLIKTPEGFFRARPPKVCVANTIGCGDCFLAGYVSGLSRGLKTEEIIRHATAASAATAESTLSAGFDLNRAEELKKLITVNKL